MSDKFNVFDHLPHKKEDEFDDHLSFRAFVHLDHVVAKSGEVILCKCFFPPVQVKTVDNKTDFNRLLNAHLASLKASGTKVHSVDVLQGGKPAFSFTVS